MTTGKFDGYAWSENIGWIHFKNESPAYNVMSTNPALPVELSSFTASFQNNEVIVSWQTETEVNNYGFEIERSVIIDQSLDKWKKIGFVEGSGNSNSQNSYSFTDHSPNGKICKYRLKQIDTDGQFVYSNIIEINIADVLPKKIVLGQNYPNPFNPSTKINYSIPSITKNSSSQQNVKLVVYDVLGREIIVLVNEPKAAGQYEIEFDGSNLPSGVYYYQLTAGSFQETKKMVLLK